MPRAADATAEFFRELSEREREPLLARVTATFRFDLLQGGKTERWLVEVRKGELTVSRRNRKADCVLRAEKELFDRLASGERNAMAASLRGELILEGDLTQLVQAQRLFTGPAVSRQSRRAAASRRQS